MSLEIERREGMGNSRKLESKNWVEESRWRFSRVGWGGGGHYGGEECSLVSNTCQ